MTALQIIDDITEKVFEANKAGLTPYPMWGHEIALKLAELRDMVEEGDCNG